MKLYQLIRPYGEDYLDLMFTRLQMAVLQAAGAQDLDFDDFLPDWGSWMSKLLPQKPKTTAELMAELKKDKDRVLVINPDMKPKKVTFRPDQIEAMEQLRIAREAGNPVGQN